jgi:hypothetical protein
VTDGMKNMKVVAVYTATVEVLVDLGEFPTWEKAAEALKSLPAPPPPKDIELSFERLWTPCDEFDEDDQRLEFAHEVIGVCATCGAGITDGCGQGCNGRHREVKGGWVSTEHGGRVWCSPLCREHDPDDPEKGEA